MKHYYVTLTTQDTAYNVKNLVKAVDADYDDVASFKITVQSAKGNTGDIFLGGSTVTQSSYGQVLLAAGDKYETGVGLENMYALADTASQALAILLD